MSAHSRSVQGRRRSIKHLYELLAQSTPPRRSAAANRQSMVTAWLDDLYQLSPARTLPRGIQIQRRGAA